MPFKWSTEIKTPVPLEPGIYNFECTNATSGLTKQKISKNGEIIPPRPMMVLDLVIYSNEGKAHQIKLWITQEMNFLIKHFCESVGQPETFNSGECEEYFFIGKCGKVRTFIKKEEYNGETKNRIKIADFMTEEKANVWLSKQSEKTGKAPIKPTKSEEPFIEDDIPF